MDTINAIAILEALASGCSPITGEVINHDSVLNERNVIRALQIAIDHLKKEGPQIQIDIKIDEEDIQKAIKLFIEQGRNPSPNNLAGFFLGTRRFQNHSHVTNELYGKFQHGYSKGQMLDFLTQYLSKNNVTNTNSLSNNSHNSFNTNPYREIDYFQKEKFNKLSENAISQLKEKINELGVLKTENLSEHIQTARKSHPRAYEYWSEKEIELLSKAIKYTNDLSLLSECFQRGQGSIESLGQKLIYESQHGGAKS